MCLFSDLPSMKVSQLEKGVRFFNVDIFDRDNEQQRS